MSLVGREEVRMVIHCAWGLEYGSKPNEAKGVTHDHGHSFFQYSVYVLFAFPALLWMAN